MDYSGDNIYLKKYKRRNKIIAFSIIAILLLSLFSYITIYFNIAKTYNDATQPDSYCKTHKVAHLSTAALSDMSAALVLCLEDNKNIIEIFKAKDNAFEYDLNDVNSRVGYTGFIDVTPDNGMLFKYIYSTKDNGFLLVGNTGYNDSDDLFYVEEYNKAQKLISKKKYIVKKDVPRIQMSQFYTTIIEKKYNLDKYMQVLRSNYQLNMFPAMGYKNLASLVMGRSNQQNTFSIQINNCSPDYTKIDLPKKNNANYNTNTTTDINESASQDNTDQENARQIDNLFDITDLSEFPTSTCTIHYVSDRDDFNKVQDYVRTYNHPVLILINIAIYILILASLSIIGFVVIGSIKLGRTQKKYKQMAQSIIDENPEPPSENK